MLIQTQTHTHTHSLSNLFLESSYMYEVPFTALVSITTKHLKNSLEWPTAHVKSTQRTAMIVTVQQ